jgi:hypothetical protein
MLGTSAIRKISRPVSPLILAQILEVGREWGTWIKPPKGKTKGKLAKEKYSK